MYLVAKNLKNYLDYVWFGRSLITFEVHSLQSFFFQNLISLEIFPHFTMLRTVVMHRRESFKSQVSKFRFQVFSSVIKMHLVGAGRLCWR